jgi:acetyl-CoA acetyltransferase
MSRVVDAPEQGSVITGLGMSRIGRKTGTPALELTVESCRAAIADAGLASDDIDGIASLGDTSVDDAMAALGIQATDRNGAFDRGGLLGPVISGCFAVAEGAARHVLVYRTVQMIGGSVLPSGRGAPPPAPPTSRPHPLATAMGDMGGLLAAHAYSAANWLAMHCRRHMHLYGTTKEQLGWLAVNSRRNAGLNPSAVFREPMTMDDYLAARVISTPFGLFDCDVPVDGSIAFVISTPEHAASCPKPAVGVEAVGGSTGVLGGWVDRADYPRMASHEAGAELWTRTDLTPADVDIAELYDGFTFLTLAWLEALGFCGEGEGGSLLDGGTHIALDGALPLNTYGGQLSAGRMHGYWVLHEACTQLRGDGGARQVAPQPEVAAVSVGGGPIAGCMLLSRAR